jgi:hypothetical protein
MISILLTLLVAVLVIGIAYWVITLVPLPPPFKQVALVICALILLIWVLNIVGVVGPAWRIQVR